MFQPEPSGQETKVVEPIEVAPNTHPPIVPEVAFITPASVTLNSAFAGVESPAQNLMSSPPVTALLIPTAPEASVMDVVFIVQPPIAPEVAVIEPVIVAEEATNAPDS